MKLSQRISAVGTSATIAITSRAKQMQAEGHDIVSFGAGEPDFDTPQFIKDAAKDALDAGDTKYTPRSAIALKQAIADKLARENGITVDPSQVLVTFGGKNALYLAFQAVIDPGDTVLIPAPYWVSYPEMVTLAGGKSVILHAGADAEFKITPQQILDAADGAKFLVLNSPSNPSGARYSPDELQAIADAVMQTDLIVFADEIYENLIYGKTKFVSFATLADGLAERTVTFNGLAKSFSMTGWRLGYVVLPPALVPTFDLYNVNIASCACTFHQKAAVEALRGPQDRVEEMVSEFRRRRDWLVTALDELPGMRCVTPGGAFYAFPNISDTGLSSEALARRLLDEAGVATLAGDSFGRSGNGFVRLSYANSLENLRRAVDRIRDFLKQQ